MRTIGYCTLAIIFLLVISCKKEHLEPENTDNIINNADTAGNQHLIPDFRDEYLGSFICNKYYKQVHQDSVGNLYWTNTLVSTSASVVVEAESDSALLIRIDGGQYSAYHTSTDCFGIPNGSINFLASGDSISIYLQSGPMNSYRYTGAKTSI